MLNQEVNILNEIAKDTLNGLRSHPKFLSSKYFYDEKGSEIFQDIMNMPEYYLTNSEYEIFAKQTDLILKGFNPRNENFNLIEFGAGDGLKTKILLRSLSEQNISFNYIPIDISEDALNGLVYSINNEFPNLNIIPKAGDYFEMFEDLNKLHFERKVILFLGSNIGNFKIDESINFLQRIGSLMNSNDKLFIGFDLKKDPRVIQDAYNDKHGHTRDFNLNLLNRLNRELGADFNTDNFIHCPLYDPLTGAAKSYLISTINHTVKFKELNTEIKFERWEPIYTEMSQKYDLRMISMLAEKSGFQITCNFFDEKRFFLNSLWALKKDEI